VKYPKKMYKGEERLRVFDAYEEEKALKNEWMSGEEYVSLLKGGVKEVTKDDNVLESIPELKPKVNLNDEYEKATGKRAIVDRGSHKGKETNAFKKWKKGK